MAAVHLRTMESWEFLLMDGRSVNFAAIGLDCVHMKWKQSFSPGDQFVARVLRRAGFGTLLFDLLAPEEEAADLRTRQLRFDIDLPARRLMDVTRWV